MSLEEQLLRAWRRHNEILLLLFDNVPVDGFSAVPLASRGRDVAAQFFHLQRVRSRLARISCHGKAAQSSDPG